MTIYLRFFVALHVCILLALLTACNSPTPPSDPTTQPQDTMTRDPHSYARPDEAAATHLDLDILVDFDAKILSGSATWTLALGANANEAVFDSRGLDIRKVTDAFSGKELKFTLGAEKEFLGQPLTIALSQGVNKVKIEYATTDKAEGLQWLSPQQTAGKKHPFLFSQSQAILARTWLPCQDSPGIRFTYNAKVKVNKPLLPVMSASNPQQRHGDSTDFYTYSMKQRIPAYLMAIAVGDLEFKPVGARTGVYAEPSMLEKCAWEFADMEKMLEAAEKLYGAYAWERYDVIVLPPSFPFGGMENPRLTFATPTVVAGDRSLTSLVAHELAHSWSGNLVTNANWDDFWMNEGFTVYFEMRIMESLYGKDYTDMLSVLSYQDLMEEINDKMSSNPDDTHLKLNLTGRNPDDGMSPIAYDKGCFFLKSIEAQVGREKFDAFLKSYFTAHAFQSMTTEKFLDYLKANLGENDSAKIAAFGIDKWIFSPGMPADFVPPTSARLEKVQAAVAAWKGGAAPASLDVKGWSTHEWIQFLRGLPEEMTTAQMAELDKTFGFSKSGNSEIQFAWFIPSIEHNYQPAFPAMENFLMQVGRRKFIRPLFKELVKTEEGKKWAEKVYEKSRNNYHSVTYNSVDEILGVQ